MVIGSPRERPVKLAFRRSDGMFTDADQAQPHQACCIALAVLIATGAEPLPVIVGALAEQAHGHARPAQAPEHLDQSTDEFSSPCSSQMFEPDVRARKASTAVWPDGKLRSVEPSAVRGVGEHHDRWIVRVPCVLCRTISLRRMIPVKGGSGGRFMHDAPQPRPACRCIDESA